MFYSINANYNKTKITQPVDLVVLQKIEYQDLIIDDIFKLSDKNDNDFYYKFVGLHGDDDKLKFVQYTNFKNPDNVGFDKDETVRTYRSDLPFYKVVGHSDTKFSHKTKFVILLNYETIKSFIIKNNGIIEIKDNISKSIYSQYCQILKY